MARKAKKISKTTTNRGEFNRAYKAYLEHSGQIYCSYCKYHRGENSNKKYYGGYRRMNGHMKITYPSWKLVSKNRKQWMVKPMKIEEDSRWGKDYIDITW
jgi:hypothetical protein